jgi:glycerol kinase
MKRDWPGEGAGAVLRVDGGMVVSDWAMQGIADILGAPVDRPKVAETTALGAAWLAGMKAGLYPQPAEFARAWSLDRRFEPRMDAERREAKYAGWQDAVRRTLSGGGRP